MGKHRLYRQHISNQGMDKHNERNRPGPAESRSLSSNPSGAGGQRDVSSGHDYPAIAAASNRLPDSTGNRHPGRKRIPSGAPPQVKRATTAESVNKILNDPTVFSAIATPEIAKFDASALMADEQNFAFTCQGGCLLFIFQEPGIYEAHVAFLPAFRGAYAKQAFHIAARLMFMGTSAITLLLRIPDSNKAARHLAAALGAKKEFHRAAAWPTADGLIGRSYWTMRYDSWIANNAEMVACGEHFMWRINITRQEMGNEPETFDECAKPYFGALILMACAGRMDKGTILFNRFAAFANLPIYKLVSHAPAVIDTGETLLQFADGDFKVLMCRPRHS